MKNPLNPAPLLIPRSLANALLRFYDYPAPHLDGRVIRGYDRAHALRTAKMSAAVAARLGHPQPRLVAYQVACLLHDLGRAGLDRRLFGRIWSWVRARGIPTRPREWRAVYPDTRYGRESEAFLARYGPELKQAGIRLDGWAKEQIEMRLGYARRLMRQLKQCKPALRKLGVHWSSWMGQVMLYYYYPEKLDRAPGWVRELAEVLVACEQFEAFSNWRRGRDYYRRTRESFADGFAYLDKLCKEGILSEVVMSAVRSLAAEGAFDDILAEARGGALSRRDRAELRGLSPRVAACR